MNYVRNMKWAACLGFIMNLWGVISGVEQSDQPDPQEKAILQKEPASVRIRPFDAHDYEAVAAIAEENVYWLNGSGKIKVLLQENFCQVYVCTMNEHVVGFIIFNRTEADPWTGEICYMAIKLPYRHYGCGYLLLKKALHELEKIGVERICLCVRADNERAIHFYHSCGFGIITSDDDQELPHWIKMCRFSKQSSHLDALYTLFNVLTPPTK